MTGGGARSDVGPARFAVARFLRVAACFLFLFAASCSSDKDESMLLDIFGLIDEYYLTAADHTELVKNAFVGIERALTPDLDGSDLLNFPLPTPNAPASAHDAPPAPSPSPGAADDDTAGGPAEKKKGPLKVAIDGPRALLTIGNESASIDIPNGRKEAAKALLAGYRFVAARVGGDENRKTLDSALSYMMFKLDPHSDFLGRQDYGELKAETSGQFGGVGIEVGVRGDVLTVIAPIEGTPAAQAGLRPMDRIIKVDGKPTDNMSLFEAVNLIRGEIGTSVILTIRRKLADREDVFDVSLVRGVIPVNTIKAEMLPGKVAWVRLFSFNVDTAEDLKKSLDGIEEKNGRLRGVILDLRNNPGGLLNQAVDTADLFLESGMIVNTIGRGRLQEKEIFAKQPGTRGDVPLVVLVNSGSASGSEIVAGALQDHGRALIAGTRTFGKGSVQSIFKLSADTGLRLTTALYYTPSARSIQAEGIVPDVLVRYPDGDEQLVALYASESALKGHLTSPRAVKDEADVTLDALTLRDHYLKTGEIAEDEEHPEKGDWLLVLTRHILEGGDLSVPGMIERSKQLVVNFAN